MAEKKKSGEKVKSSNHSSIRKSFTDLCLFEYYYLDCRVSGGKVQVSELQRQVKADLLFSNVFIYLPFLSLMPSGSLFAWLLSNCRGRHAVWWKQMHWMRSKTHALIVHSWTSNNNKNICIKMMAKKEEPTGGKIMTTNVCVWDFTGLQKSLTLNNGIHKTISINCSKNIKLYEVLIHRVERVMTSFEWSKIQKMLLLNT